MPLSATASDFLLHTEPFLPRIPSNQAGTALDNVVRVVPEGPVGDKRREVSRVLGMAGVLNRSFR